MTPIITPKTMKNLLKIIIHPKNKPFLGIVYCNKIKVSDFIITKWDVFGNTIS
jgi:hypothetical protein